jgi:transglutaminase-like putative cysteine protease
MIRRRELLASGAVVAACWSGLGRRSLAAVQFEPRPGAWRSFAVTTRIEIRNAGAGPCQAWIPVPQPAGFAWQRFERNEWEAGNASGIRTVRDPRYGADFLQVTWAENVAAPAFSVTSLFSTCDRYVDLAGAQHGLELPAAERARYLAATRLLPTGGVVGAVSGRITKEARTDLTKVRAIYDWVVENAYRDGNVRGCGSGDILEMLRSDDFGGKCADLNGLFVALVRAAGVPARDVYGVRVAPSRFGYKSLGAGSANVTKAQHCRAEVWLDGFGWVAMDPADVRKVMLEEQAGGLAATDPKVVAARTTLFGAWEGNWLAYNTAHDVELPGSTAGPNGFLMYPEVEIGGERRDCLLPDTVAYTITAAERTA